MERACKSINPQPLVSSERKLVEDLRSFWQIHCDKPEYCDIQVCLLRNLPKVGEGHLAFREEGTGCFEFGPMGARWIEG